MAHIYSAKGKRIRLQASGAAGLRFRTPGHAVRAARDLRAAAGPAGRRFHHFLLLEPGATLPARHTRHVVRPVPVLVEPDSGLRLLATEEITLRLKAKVTARQRDKLLRSLGLTVVTRNEFHPRQYLVTLQAGGEARTLELANKLAADELVEFAAPNFVSEHRKLAEPNDPLFPSQWHLHNTGRGGGKPGEDVGAPAAWAITTGSPRVVIAIIDDGVDLGHPDLRANIWVNPDLKAPDRHGRNFYDNNFDPRPHYFQPPFNNPESNDIHGTACAGVAAARGDNRHGCAGIAYDSRILAVKIFGSDNMASNSRVADAIRYAGRRSQVISCSWSSAPNPD
ncbi:MAG: S8 family serine peptidase, partial [Candidatus Solibacter usitatus]|nr:S8 family serine peptidase [Candidatus Solibacter usitatus]